MTWPVSSAAVARGARLILSVKTAALGPSRESLALAMTSSSVPKGLVELIRVSKLVGLDLENCYPSDSKKRHVGAE